MADRHTIVIGAGAAGLMTAIVARQRDPEASVLLLDGATRPGAKILVSGGGRCNVTNARVTEHDFAGAPATMVRKVLRAYTVADTIAFFLAAGVSLHEEPDGKLFPDSNSARDVLRALLDTARTAGVELRPGHRVRDLTREGGTFRVATEGHTFSAERVVLAAGGRALPKSGSDGNGYALAEAFGHTIVPTTPALAPLVLEPAAGDLHRPLSGVSHEAALSVQVDGRIAVRVRGALLWTHFGISGPAALDVSRHLLRARLEGRAAGLLASLVPGGSYEWLETFWLEERRTRPKATVASTIGRLLPASAGTVFAVRASVDPATPLAELTREARRELTRVLTALPLPVADSRGYTYAEATAGGVDLREVDTVTMESRRCPGLFLAGEILDVDGRLGGFNFQWAWASGAVAGRGLANARRGAAALDAR